MTLKIGDIAAACPGLFLDAGLGFLQADFQAFALPGEIARARRRTEGAAADALAAVPVRAGKTAVQRQTVHLFAKAHMHGMIEGVDEHNAPSSGTVFLIYIHLLTQNEKTLSANCAKQHGFFIFSVAIKMGDVSKSTVYSAVFRRMEQDMGKKFFRRFDRKFFEKIVAFPESMW